MKKFVVILMAVAFVAMTAMVAFAGDNPLESRRGKPSTKR